MPSPFSRFLPPKPSRRPPSRAAAPAAPPGATSAPAEPGDARWTYGPTPVASTNVESVAYSEPDGVLQVVFRAKGGRPSVTYWYYGVTSYTYADMLDAPSRGRFVHTDLTPRYAFRRVR